MEVGMRLDDEVITVAVPLCAGPVQEMRVFSMVDSRPVGEPILVTRPDGGASTYVLSDSRKNPSVSGRDDFLVEVDTQERSLVGVWVGATDVHVPASAGHFLLNGLESVEKSLDEIAKTRCPTY